MRPRKRKILGARRLRSLQGVVFESRLSRATFQMSLTVFTNSYPFSRYSKYDAGELTELWTVDIGWRVSLNCLTAAPSQEVTNVHPACNSIGRSWAFLVRFHPTQPNPCSERLTLVLTFHLACVRFLSHCLHHPSHVGLPSSNLTTRDPRVLCMQIPQIS